ncbi:hypothetical protein BJV78DRAFT_1254463 [Lactifluus subvellereus]|nr:hypothetical protein BJV78DRAFT_1254463 [Lactifluus subvellereus]
MMQTNQQFELYRGPRNQVSEVYLNGNQYPPYQTEAIENVYYWYDGNVPYYTDATACQPLDDTFFHMNVPGYSHADKSQHQQLSDFNPHLVMQESLYPYTLQLYEPRLMNVVDGTPLYNSPISPSTSLSSLHWSDSEPSPTPCHFSDDAISRLPSAVPTPQTALPAYSSPLEAPARPLAPERPLPTPPALEKTRRDVLGRRAPKQRRITRAVQPLACYFCRGRKIACGPPADLGSGNRTCEPCARRRLVCEFPAESYRGRRTPGSKTASARPQR